MRFSMGAMVARAAALAAIALTLLVILDGAKEIQAAREAREVREKLRKLSALTIRNFPERNLDSSELFWKAIGREGDPIKDPWGTAYQISVREEAGVRRYFWSSAGPDRRFATRDDLVVEVPYPSGALTAPDSVPGADARLMPDSMDAK